LIASSFKPKKLLLILTLYLPPYQLLYRLFLHQQELESASGVLKYGSIPLELQLIPSVTMLEKQYGAASSVERSILNQVARKLQLLILQPMALTSTLGKNYGQYHGKLV
jgi:hypothetical protein